MSITTYTELVTAVGTNWPLRTDLSGRAEEAIANAEARFKRDKRIRKMEFRSLSVSADGTALPSDFQSLESLEHNGATYFGPVEIIGAGQLGTQLALHGTTGPPAFAAIANGKIYWAPVPDTTYTLRLGYWRKILALGASQATNWLLTSHPDIYLYGSLTEVAALLKNWKLKTEYESVYNQRAEELHAATWQEQFGGLTRRQVSAIGG